MVSGHRTAPFSDDDHYGSNRRRYHHYHRSLGDKVRDELRSRYRSGWSKFENAFYLFFAGNTLLVVYTGCWLYH